MSQSLTYHCDVCGAVKKEANRWLRAYEHNPGPGITIVPWERSAVRKEDEMHLCGMECAHKAMAKALTEAQ